jgi:hypothetical protein
MSQRPSAQDAARLLLHLAQTTDDMRHERVAGSAIDPHLALLRNWQSARLERTYDDLLASKRYGPACRFFLSDIYAARDFSQRDHDLERLYDYLSRLLPAAMLRLLANAVTLNTLTKELDAALLDALVGRLGVTDTLSAAQYAEGYRLCDNYVERARQIDLIVAVGRDVDATVKLPFASTTLRLARGPAHSMGWQELQDFLERGFHAFKQMGGASTFLKTIRDREMLILDRIFSGHPDPFDLNDHR